VAVKQHLLPIEPNAFEMRVEVREDMRRQRSEEPIRGRFGV